MDSPKKGENSYKSTKLTDHPKRVIILIHKLDGSPKEGENSYKSIRVDGSPKEGESS